MNVILEKMESGVDRYEIVTHKGSNCDCGFSESRIPIRSKWNTAWKIVRTHKSKWVWACRFDIAANLSRPTCG
jgi:hypothetical protein